MDLRRNPAFRKKERWEEFLDSFLLSYSQIFFSKDRWVGVVLFAATAMNWDLFLGGAIAVLLVNVVASSFHLSKETIRAGMFGYNALLIGLAFPALFKVNVPVLVVFLLAIFAITVITAALHAALSYYFNLPVLTLPFLIVMYLVLAAFPSVRGMAPNTKWIAFPVFGFSIPEIVGAYFKSLGAIFFSPNVTSGIILFIGLLLFSRIATVLSFMGFAVGVGLMRWVFNLPAEHLYLSIGFNFILTAIAMGGIWFVPQMTSFLFAGGAVFLCAIILAGSANLFSFLGLPVLIFPFNLTVLTLLYAMRQRTMDLHPKSVDFISGTPEANLTYYRTRVTRFGANFINRISLPFLGTWVCTQGHEGDFTHQGLWEHAFDFEVCGPSGKFCKNAGKETSDYFCYKLPVLACGDGQAVKVLNDIPDNPIGDPNLKQNWGNVVVIQHGPSLFSMICHLLKGSVKIKEGDIVKRGNIIALCGNSGRSVVPHLHFQLQNTARIGSPTIQSEFHEVIVEGESSSLHSTYVPRVGDAMRNVRRQEEIAGYFSFPIGQKITLSCRSGKKVWKEEIESGIDLYGNLKLISPAKKAVLYFENKNSVFMIYDFQGAKDSALFVLFTSVPRVPYEWVENLMYYDTLPLRKFLPWEKRAIMDFISPFLGPKGMKIRYHCERSQSDFIVSGGSQDTARFGTPPIATKAIFREEKGWIGGCIVQDGKTFEVTRE